MCRVRAVVDYADYGDLNNYFTVNWINYPRRVQLWLSYFSRMSASRNGNEKRRSDETSYIEVSAAVAPIVAESRNFRRLIEIKETSFPASIAVRFRFVASKRVQ